MMRIVKERYDLIAVIDTIEVRDTQHAKEEFHNHFPELSWNNSYLPKLKKGLRKIVKKYGYKEDRYVIISRKTGLRIPLHFRPDRKSKDEVIYICAIPTTLSPKEVYRKYNDIKVFVENNRNSFKWFPLQEGYDLFAENGEVYSTFVEIDLED